MARQKGIVKLKGTIGDISFYKSKDGYLAREKGGVEKERIFTDPAFQRTRENGAEFGRAGTAGRLLRTALRPVLLRTSDRNVTGRLTKEMVKVVKADSVSERGERNVLDGELSLLEGFEFNSNGRLAATLYAPYEVEIDRAAGTSSITIPEFVSQNSLAYPQGATHFKLVSAVTVIDFENDEFELATSESAETLINAEAVEEIVLSNAFEAGTSKPIILVFGIEFYQLVNGKFYSLRNGAFNSLSIVAVEGLVPSP